MITREEDFQQVKRLLDYPMEQRPHNDLIVANMLRTERQLLNEANSQNRGWSIKTVTVASVVDQAEYNVQPPGGSNFILGKALFAYRDIGNSNILPVPFTDFLAEFSNQKYQFWIEPFGVTGFPGFSGEKLAFYRDGTNTMMRIFPIPSEVKTYSIVFGVGLLDWTQFAWSDVPQFPEYADYRQLLTALRTIKSCAWEGLSFQDNMSKRSEIRADLSNEVQVWQPEWRAFTRDVRASETISQIGNWYD